ncbi:MAG: TrkH family potassium uptake protein [Clostridia bacterium]|nr:TrkH family potassium uptake protein [Clostridia bacterium]
MNYGMIKRILGYVLLIEALCLTLPLICSLVYGEPHALPVWTLCICICLMLGIVLTLGKPKSKQMFAKEGFVTVALSWIVISLFGAVPFVISGFIPSFIDALFETVSGFTTTGASILKDVERLPHSMLFWRSFTHWIGGMGVLVFIVAILPVSADSFYLVKAESPGPSVSKLVPKVRTTAKILYGIYILFTLIEIVMLICGGMKIFDALTFSFGTAGTGGFAVKNSGLADYSSYSQIVITVFMIIFGVDFSFYYLVLMRKFRSAVKHEEVWGYLAIIAASVIIISINCAPLFSGIGETVKHVAFQVGSIITTTGYSTVDFNHWPELSKAVIVMLMFFGACAGSTGGGIKISRIMILVKSIVKEVKLLAHPKSTIKIKMSGRTVEHETIRAVNVFMAAYLLIFVVSAIIISMDNFDFTTNFTAVAATLNNIGPGLSKVGPATNFSLYSPLSKTVLIFDMLIGRLEIFPILILLAPTTWKK